MDRASLCVARACVGAALGCLVLLAGCTASMDGLGQGAGHATGGAQPTYVLATAVSGDNSATTYVKLLTGVPTGTIDLSDSREFPGWSDIKVSDGKLFVSSGESPIVSRFRLGADGRLEADGMISFGNHAKTADMYQHVFISPEKAYFLGEAGEYVVWNPATMEIRGSVPLPKLAVRDAIDPAPSLDRGMIVRGGRLYHAVAWTDYKNYKMLPGSALFVVDVIADRFVEVIDVGCPDLNVATIDAAGDLYFSNWVYSPAATFMNAGAHACVVKIPAGAGAIDAPATLTFKDVTGGHEGAAVSVLTSGKALASVFFEDRQPFDPKKDDVFGWIFGANWKTYEIDLKARTAKEVPGLDWHSGGYYTASIDGADYLLMPGKGYTSTRLYQLDRTGAATMKAETKGWATRFFRLR